MLLAFPGEELNLKAEDYFTQEQINLAQNYRIPKYWFFALETLLLIIFLVLFVVTHLNGKLAEFSKNIAGKNTWLISSIYASYLIILWNIIIFPLHLYTGFIYEHKFNLSNQLFPEWIKRYLLAEFLTAAVFIAGITVFYIIMNKFPRHWWILAGTGFSIFVILSTFAIPVLILPLFNRFTPMPEGELRQKTIETVKKAGINIEDIYIMDASSQTKKGNAYFIGLGSTTRIVLYDTLKDYSIDETLAIIAHEAGHWKYNHIIKGIIMCIAAGFCFLSFLYMLLTKIGHILNISSQSDIKTLPLIILLLVIINLFSLPVQNSISRHFERQADRTALELTENPSACVKLDQRLAVQNLSEITPNKFLAWALYTHPPVMERIAMAELYVKK
jgi:STE24 endopeptidase